MPLKSGCCFFATMSLKMGRDPANRENQQIWQKVKGNSSNEPGKIL